MTESKFNRRDFLKAASVAALAGTSRGNTRSADPVYPFPFVDGLVLALPDYPEVYKSSGLSAFLLDASSGEQVKTTDGSIRFQRSFNSSVKSITAARQKLRALPNTFHSTNGRDVARAFKEKKTAVFLQVQGGGEIVGEELDRLDVLHELGLRVLQLTHHHDNPIAGGGIEKTPSGVTKLGIQAIERMNALGIIPDLSHASDQTALDTVKASKKPVILSHGAARALVNNARCAPDEVIRAIAGSGGVMGIFMMSFWLTTDAVPTVDHYVKQIRLVVNIGGIDAAGIANDFPLSGEESLIEAKGDNATAVKNYLPWWESIARMGVLGFDRWPTHVAIPELNNIDRIPSIYRFLQKAGFKNSELEKIMGGNWIRVLTTA
jgi:membrane dipeptidase